MLQIFLNIYRYFQFRELLPFSGHPVAQMVRNLPVMLATWVNLWIRKIPWRREWQLTPIFLPGESWTEEPCGFRVHGIAKLDTHTHTHTHTNTYQHYIKCKYSKREVLSIFGIWKFQNAAKKFCGHRVKRIEIPDYQTSKMNTSPRDCSLNCAQRYLYNLFYW